MRGLVLSLLFHAGLVVAGIVYLPKAARIVEGARIVPIELVTVSSTTNIRAAAPDPEPEPEPDPEPEPEPPVDAPIEQPPAPVEDPTPAPETVAPEPEPVQPDPEPEIEPEPQPVAPEPDPEPEPQETPEVPAEDSFGDFLNNLDRDLSNESGTATPDEGARRSASGDGERMTATLRDLFHSQAYRCWRSVLDMPYPENLGVVVEVRLERDGTLASPPRVLDEARIRASGNPFWLTAAERGRAAVIECGPYSMPPENYSEWRLIEVNFSVDRDATR